MQRLNNRNSSSSDSILILIFLTAFVILLATTLVSSGYANTNTPDFSNYPCSFPECTYDLVIANQTYPIRYQVWSENENRTAVAELEAIIANIERKSLLAKVMSDDGGVLILYIPKDVLNTAVDGHRFTILINGEPAEYEEAQEPQWGVGFDYRQLMFKMDRNTTEIEIIGQRMIPEMPLIAILVMGLSIGAVIGARLFINRRI